MKRAIFRVNIKPCAKKTEVICGESELKPNFEEIETIKFRI